MTSNSPQPPPSNAIKELTETLTQFVQWIATLIRQRKWFTLLLVINAGLILFCTPDGIVPKFLKDLYSLELPQWYKQYFWLVVAGIFVAALVIAVKTLPPKGDIKADVRERKSIKGLRAFGVEDAEIFSKLQRNRNIKEVIETASGPNFRFGILLGESGCGKTSLIQAGILPQLSSSEGSHRAIYVRFTNRDAFESVSSALMNQLHLTKADIYDTNFIFLLRHSVETTSQTLILFFD